VNKIVIHSSILCCKN